MINVLQSKDMSLLFEGTSNKLLVLPSRANFAKNQTHTGGQTVRPSPVKWVANTNDTQVGPKSLCGLYGHFSYALFPNIYIYIKSSNKSDGSLKILQQTV